MAAVSEIPTEEVAMEIEIVDSALVHLNETEVLVVASRTGVTAGSVTETGIEAGLATGTGIEAGLVTVTGIEAALEGTEIVIGALVVIVIEVSLSSSA